MCFMICLGHIAQGQQREIILVFLKTLPCQYFSLVAHPITLIMGCFEGQQGRESGLMSAASAAWPRPLVRQKLLKESWRSLQPTSGPDEVRDTQVLPPGKDCRGNRDVKKVIQHFLRESSSLTLLNGSTAPKSLCQPGEVLVAAQAGENYFRLQLICLNWGKNKEEGKQNKTKPQRE